MHIKLVAQISGTRNGVDWPKPGEVLEVPDAEGAGLVSTGLAVEIEVEKKPRKVETAARKQVVETAAIQD